MTKRGKWWLVLLLLLVTCGGAASFVPKLLWSDGVDYSKVTSIREDPTFQSSTLLAKAWALPVASLYKKAHVEFQHNGSFCGPTSLVNVLHSQGLSASQEHILDGTDTTTLLGFLPGGLSLDSLAEIATTTLKQRVTVLRDLSFVAFARHMHESNDPRRRYIVNFHRGPLFAQGGGHHSPIGGYLMEEDRVLVIDVNDSYKPWLVSPKRLFDAIDTVDPGTQAKRGLLLIER